MRTNMKLRKKQLAQACLYARLAPLGKHNSGTMLWQCVAILDSLSACLCMALGALEISSKATMHPLWLIVFAEEGQCILHHAPKAMPKSPRGGEQAAGGVHVRG